MRRVLFHPITILVFTLVLVVSLYSLNRTITEIESSGATIHGLDQEINQTQSKITKLQQDLAQAETPLAQETILRNELLLQKPGEVVVQLPDLPVARDTATGPSASPQPWQQWWQLTWK